MKRTPLQRRTPLRARTELRRKSPLRSGDAPLHRTPIKAVSQKRQRQLRTYARLRAAYLEANQWCQSPAKCGRRATEIQHRRGRDGDRLLDVTWWAASCHDCNMRAETDTGWALATGWLVRINSKERTP